MTVFIICCVAIFLVIAVVLTTLYVISYRQRQKKKHNFGIKKVKSSVCMMRNIYKVVNILSQNHHQPPSTIQSQNMEAGGGMEVIVNG